MAVAISDFLISEAMAQAGNLVEVYASGTVIASGYTDATGTVALYVPPNQVNERYYVCFNGATPGLEGCFQLTREVQEGEVIVAEATTCGDSCWELLSENVSIEPLEDHAEVFQQDPSLDHKVLICHKPNGNNPHMISVSGDALDAHIAHGDTPTCPETAISGTEETDDSKGNKGNNGNNGKNDKNENT